MEQAFNMWLKFESKLIQPDFALFSGNSPLVTLTPSAMINAKFTYQNQDKIEVESLLNFTLAKHDDKAWFFHQLGNFNEKKNENILMADFGGISHHFDNATLMAKKTILNQDSSDQSIKKITKSMFSQTLEQ